MLSATLTLCVAEAVKKKKHKGHPSQICFYGWFSGLKKKKKKDLSIVNNI